jgi:hypothetical protein
LLVTDSELRSARSRRNLVVATGPGEGRFTIRSADLHPSHIFASEIAIELDSIERYAWDQESFSFRIEEA